LRRQTEEKKQELLQKVKKEQAISASADGARKKLKVSCG
jgi:hypothetical protein